MKSLKYVFVGTAAAALMMAGQAKAEWPEKSIEFVIPFGAGGGTDNQGHILKAAYGLGDSARVGFTYFISEYGEARLGQKIDYNRLQLDIQLRF